MIKEILKNGIKTILIISNIILSVITIISAYSGLVNPVDSSIFAVLVMGFPALAVLVVISLITLLIFKQWKIAIIPTVTLIATYSTILVYFPFNIFTETAETKTDSTFTLLTYNVMSLTDYQPEYSNIDEANRTIQYILDMDADIVALQECYKVFLNKGTKKMSEEQQTELLDKYPYRRYSNPDIAILSKYPTKDVSTQIPSLNGGSCKATIIEHPAGDITIINLHLQSISLQKEDKELYKDVTSLKRDEKETFGEVRTQLISKLATAFHGRAIQAEELHNYITEDVTTQNLIVCGDFNDTPASYAYRTIKGNMKDAYTQCAFWPTITYHADRFYFRIDQVFYRGNINATAIKRGNVKSSDHYPLLTTFQYK